MYCKFGLTLILPVPSLRLAKDAALCDSYSRKQKPRFFFLSSGELYMITSYRPAIGSDSGSGLFLNKENIHLSTVNIDRVINSNAIWLVGCICKNRNESNTTKKYLYLYRYWQVFVCVRECLRAQVRRTRIEYINIYISNWKLDYILRGNAQNLHDNRRVFRY